MRAAICHQFGGPEVVSIEEIDRPIPKNNEVLIRVKATSVNRTDCGFRAGEPKFARIIMGLTKPRYPILGCEFAGDIVEIGAAVTEFNIGDKVFGYCEDNYNFGGHGEYKAMNLKGMLATIPEKLSYLDVVAACEGGHYALHDLRCAKIGPGSRIVINGGTGGIGSAAIQLAKHMGAEIVATCRKQHFDIVKNLGASRIIDYESHDFTDVLRGEKFDAVFDAVGKSTFAKCKPLLVKGGRYISTELGPKAENPFLALWTKVFGDYRVLFPLPVMRQEDILYLRSLIVSGDYAPLIDKTYPFEDVAAAHEYVETGQKVGNVIIEYDVK
mgnify:CR=1 FL=1